MRRCCPVVYRSEIVCIHQAFTNHGVFGQTELTQDCWRLRQARLHSKRDTHVFCCRKRMAGKAEVEARAGYTHIPMATLQLAELDPQSRAHMRNVSGSSPYRAGPGWQATWKKMWSYKGQGNPGSTGFNCGNKAAVGGHLCYNRPDGLVYIIPICGECNSTTYNM